MNIRRLLTLLAASHMLLAAHAAIAQTSSPSAASIPAIRDLKHPTAEDKLLIKSVRRRLARTSGLNPSNISVLAHGGVVVLTGSVPAQADADLAASSASGVQGVVSVINKLTMRAPM